VRRQLADWRDKWVYQETRYAFTRGLQLDPSQLKNYFENHKFKYKISRDTEPTFEGFKAQVKQDAWLNAAQKRLDAKVDSLVHYFPVEINTAVLDSIQVTASKKSKWMSVQLFKRSSNRLAFPIVDPAWGL
jgi:predicted solute-binding protein